MIKETFMDKLDHYEYPNSKLLVQGIQPNTWFEYISSTYLNGLINYVNPVHIVLMERYTMHNEDKIKERISELEKACHTKLGIFDDDIIILATVKDVENEYYIFWFDGDVSDCCLGRYCPDGKVTVGEMKVMLNEWLESLIKEDRDQLQP